MEYIKAIQKGEALLRDMDACLADEENFYAWWLGQSGFLLQWKGHRVLLDPYLSDSLTVKYLNTDQPHTRMTELVIQPGQLKNISIVTSSHNHTDHLDAETLVPILANNPDIHFLIPEANRRFVCDRVKCEEDFPVGLTDGASKQIGVFTFHGIPAKHNEIERDDKGRCIYMGYVIEFGPFRVYHSGDTLWFDQLVKLLKPFSVDLAILPINGNFPERKVAGNLNTEEAARLGKAIGARFVIPCHYDMFTFNTADVSEFEKVCDDIGQPYVTLQSGGRFEYSMARSLKTK